MYFINKNNNKSTTKKTLYLNNDIIKKLNKSCIYHDVSMSLLINNIIQLYYNNNKN